MGTIGLLSDTALGVQCGQEVSTQLTVRNTGTVVDEFTITILGESAAWAVIEPSTLSLFPDAEGIVTVRFRPPRHASTPQGRMPFGVQVASREDPSSSAVEEGSLDIAPFSEISAEIVPRTSRGRFAGSHELAIDNRGNAPAEIVVAGTDPDGRLNFRFSPTTLSAPPGTAIFSRLRVSAGGGLWRGMAQTAPFNVSVSAKGQPAIRLDASFQQQPMIPAWLPRTIAVCFALVLASVVAWVGVIKPSLNKAVEASPVVKQAKDNIDKIAAETGVTLKTPPPNSSTTTTPSPATGEAPEAGLGNPVSVPLTLIVPPGEDAGGNSKTMELSFASGGAPSLSIAGILVQNPYNDAGIVTVLVHKADQDEEDADIVVEHSLLNQTLPNISLNPPMSLAESDTLRVRVLCTAPGAIPQGPDADEVPNDECRVTVLVSGYVRGGVAAPTPRTLR